MKEANETTLLAKMRSNYMTLTDSPYELTLEYASDNGFTVDEEGFPSRNASAKTVHVLHVTQKHQ